MPRCTGSRSRTAPSSARSTTFELSPPGVDARGRTVERDAPESRAGAGAAARAGGAAARRADLGARSGDHAQRPTRCSTSGAPRMRDSGVHAQSRRGRAARRSRRRPARTSARHRPSRRAPPPVDHRASHRARDRRSRCVSLETVRRFDPAAAIDGPALVLKVADAEARDTGACRRARRGRRRRRRSAPGDAGARRRVSASHVGRP